MLTHFTAVRGLARSLSSAPPAADGTSRLTRRRGWWPALALASVLALAACGPEPLSPAAADSLTTTADVPVSSAPAALVLANVNEPAGFTPFASNRFDTKPTWPRSNNATLGGWYSYTATNPNLTLTTDATAPVSASSVVRTRFPVGMKAGGGAVDMGGWANTASTPFRKVYFSMWIKIEGKDYENQKSGTKAGFFGVGTTKVGSNQLFFFLDNGLGVQRLQSDFQVQFRQQGIPQPNGWVVRDLLQNVSRVHLMTVGGWHHWEAVMAVNTLGAANGVFKMWIDGTQTHNYSDVVYITPAAPLGLFLWKWNPTWGGSGGVRTRADYIDIDQVYMSGVP